MKFIIPGNPIPKMRPRFSKGRTYDHQEREKNCVKKDLMFQATTIQNGKDCVKLRQLKELSEASAFRMSFEFHCQATKADPWGIKQNLNKIDVDNLVKFYCDACNSILYSDDHKIVALKAFKCYNPIPKVIIDIEPMQDTALLGSEHERVLKAFSICDLQDFLYDIGMLAHYSPSNIEVMSRSEYEIWLIEVTEKKLNFANKWGAKLNKIAGKKNAL